MKKCKKCDVELTKKNHIKVNGYVRANCRSCTNKIARKKQKKKLEILREWRKWYP